MTLEEKLAALNGIVGQITPLIPASILLFKVVKELVARHPDLQVQFGDAIAKFDTDLAGLQTEINAFNAAHPPVPPTV